MLIKIDNQEFNLTEETVETMISLISDTEKDARERGFNFCQKESGEIVPGPISKGQENEVKMRGCSFYKKISPEYSEFNVIGKNVGSFHTHRVDEPFSFSDYLGAINKALERSIQKPHRNLICLGTPGNEIKCRSIKYIPEDFIFGISVEYMEGLESEQDLKRIESYFTEPINLPK